MLVEEVFDSHSDAWKALKQPAGKSTKRNVFGDIYQPLPNIADKWSASNYERSAKGHVHDNRCARFKDIEKVYRPGRHPKLLLGDVEQSYLWSSPLIQLKEAADERWKTAHHRFYPCLTDFMSQLQ
jgi:hypothetical protein